MIPLDSHKEKSDASPEGSPEDKVPTALFDEVYVQLHALAKMQMSKERSDHTLQPTALVHEAYMRLFGAGDISWESRRQFFGTASKIMRSLLVDHARGRRAKKRGGNLIKLSLLEDTPAADTSEQEIDILDLHESLERLSGIDTSMADSVELRYFGGLSIKETAASLGVPLRTTERRLQAASMWLRDDLNR
jgi:RNA polymerase sigma-70 factor (ECF subfamily)